MLDIIVLDCIFKQASLSSLSTKDSEGQVAFFFFSLLSRVTLLPFTFLSLNFFLLKTHINPQRDLKQNLKNIRIQALIG